MKNYLKRSENVFNSEEKDGFMIFTAGFTVGVIAGISLIIFLYDIIIKN
jgi:hypothetical protein